MSIYQGFGLHGVGQQADRSVIKNVFLILGNKQTTGVTNETFKVFLSTGIKVRTNQIDGINAKV